MQIKENISLKSLNTFGIDVKAKFYYEVNDELALKEILNHPKFTTEKKLILGGGSNLLFTGNFDGIVIKINITGIEKYKEDDEFVWVKVGAGVIWHQFVLHCIENGWGGVENLSLIPGTVGAAPMQNIGAYGVEIKQVFTSLEAILITNISLRSFDKQACKFGYRESIFKNELKDKYVITSVNLRLTKNHSFNISYGALSDTLRQNGVDQLSLKAVSDAVIDIRQSKLPDPEIIGNAGSFFKNPTVDVIEFERLKSRFPNIPFYELPGQSYKIPAGWLIEQCGWKGKKTGEIGVHKNQALVLVNYGNGNGNDIKSLAYQIKQSVTDKFGVEINPEVNIV